MMEVKGGSDMLTKMDVLTTRFVIRPTECLKAAVKQMSPDLGELLVETSLWTKREGQRTMWRDEDRIAQIKLLFVASVKSYSSFVEFEQLVGELTPSVDAFDRFWTIEKIDDEMTVKEAEEDLSPSLASQCKRTGRPLVDEWLADMGTRQTPA
jgi:hypothetical protein